MSDSAPLMSALTLLSARLACPSAVSAPETSLTGSAVTLPLASRFSAALNSVRSASTPRTAAGSAAEAASALRLRSMAPSASETRPLKPPLSASLFTEPLSTTMTSVATLPETCAVIFPAISGAMVGLSRPILSADTVPEIGPVRPFTSNASECSASAMPSTLTELVATEGSIAEMSSRGLRALSRCLHRQAPATRS